MEKHLFEPEPWEQAARGIPLLAEFPEARLHLVERFLAQYLPALLAAPDRQAKSRVWESFRYYLMAATTRRKMFALTSEEADQLIRGFGKLWEQLHPEELA